jgi:hypothetical protein
MKSPLCGRPAHHLLRAGLFGVVVAVCMSELRAAPPPSSRSADSAADVGNDDLAKRTLLALRKAAGPNRRPKRHAPASEAACSPVLSPATGEAVEQSEMRPDVGPLLPAPLAAGPLNRTPLDRELLTEEPAGWVAADRDTNTERPAVSKAMAPKTVAFKAAPSKMERPETSRASVRWADGRGDDGAVVRPAADWSGTPSLTLRGTARRMNPLRNGDRHDEDASVMSRGANPLRSR